MNGKEQEKNRLQIEIRQIRDKLKRTLRITSDDKKDKKSIDARVGSFFDRKIMLYNARLIFSYNLKIISAMRRRNVEGQMRGGSKTGLQFARIHGGHVEGVHQKV